jgi:hypothetical protein
MRGGNADPAITDPPFRWVADRAIISGNAMVADTAERVKRPVAAARAA